MNNRLRTLAASMAAGLAAASLFASVAATPAMAQCGECPDIGTPIDCPGESKSDLEALGYTLTVQTQTDGKFIVTSCSPPPPLCPSGWSADLDLLDFRGVGQDPNLGTVHWRNDPSRPISPASSFKSTEEALERGEQFPAAGYITFYAECEVDGIPGVFRSTTPVTLYNNNLMSFNPFKGELFVKDPGTKPVEFVNDDTGDVIVLNELSSLLGG